MLITGMKFPLAQDLNISELRNVTHSDNEYCVYSSKPLHFVVI